MQIWCGLISVRDAAPPERKTVTEGVESWQSGEEVAWVCVKDAHVFSVPFCSTHCICPERYGRGRLARVGQYLSNTHTHTRTHTHTQLLAEPGWARHAW